MAAAAAGQFGDTTFTKVFVGGLAWETQKDTMEKYFEQFGEILEAVVITDKITGRSKGYGFVTFREADAAARACVDPTPVIDGRRANCNLASLGAQRSKPSSPAGRNARVLGGIHHRGFPVSSPTAANFPGYSIQQRIPYSPMYGYSPFWAEYPCPQVRMGYCGSYGGASAQYPVYGPGNGLVYYPFHNVGDGAAAGAAGFFPDRSYGVSYHPQHLLQYSGNTLAAARPSHRDPPVQLASSISPLQ